MNEAPKDYDKQFDLEPSEFGPADRQQPFWGLNAKTFLILAIVGFIASQFAGWVVYGETPILLQPFLG